MCKDCYSACVCWVLGEDSPRVWEACANLTTYGRLVVRSVCVINCWHTSDPPLPTRSILLGPYSTLMVSVRLSCRNSCGHIVSQLSKALMLERNRMHVCTTHTSSRVRHRCLALRAGDGELKYLCMAPQLSQCHRLLLPLTELYWQSPTTLGSLGELFYKAQWGI